MKKHLVISTGAGMSAESGISTFRDAGGLWEQYPVMQVCSADGFARDPAIVHKFYNERRAQLDTVEPNAGHRALVDLEKYFDVDVITQNVNDSLVYTLRPGECTTPETRIDGHRVRPHIVFFQEAVPEFEPATEIVARADIFVIIGTTLSVYPAAALLRYVRPGTPVYYIDPNPADVPANVHVIRAGASEGVAELARILLDKK